MRSIRNEQTSVSFAAGWREAIDNRRVVEQLVKCMVHVFRNIGQNLSRRAACKLWQGMVPIQTSCDGAGPFTQRRPDVVKRFVRTSSVLHAVVHGGEVSLSHPDKPDEQA